MPVMEIKGYLVVNASKKTTRYLKHLDNLFLDMKWEILRDQKEIYELKEDCWELFLIIHDNLANFVEYSYIFTSKYYSNYDCNIGCRTVIIHIGFTG